MWTNSESARTSRRRMLQTASCGFGYLAFQSLAQRQAAGAGSIDTGIKPRARRVIFLCMSGGPAQLDTFDYKPQTGKKESFYLLFFIAL